MWGHKQQWISHKMNNWHQWQLKNSKAIWSYKHCRFGHFWPNFEVNGLNWQCCLAGTSKMATRIFIFSIVQGAKYLSCMKSIETHACAFLTLNISSIGTVFEFAVFKPFYQIFPRG